MIERKNYGITHLSASGKEKYISGVAYFGAAVWRGHGFHTRPKLLDKSTPRYFEAVVDPEGVGGLLPLQDIII